MVLPQLDKLCFVDFHGSGWGRWEKRKEGKLRFVNMINFFKIINKILCWMECNTVCNAITQDLVFPAKHFRDITRKALQKRQSSLLEDT